MRDPLPKVSITGRVGLCLVTFAAGRLDLPLLTPVLLYGLSLLGVMLILWEAVTYTAKLTGHTNLIRVGRWRRRRRERQPPDFAKPRS